MKNNTMDKNLNRPINTTNLRSIQINQQVPRPSGINQQAGTHPATVGMQSAPQMADRHHTGLMRLLNNTNSNIGIQESVDAASKIENSDLQKKAWVAIAKCSRFSSQDRYTMVINLKSLTEKISLLSMMIKGSLDIELSVRSNAIDFIYEFIRNQPPESPISPDLLDTINSALYSLATDHSIDDGQILLNAAMTIFKNPELMIMALQQIVQNEHLDITLKDQIQQQLLHTQACTSNTCGDLKLQIEAYNYIKDKLKYPGFREEIIKRFFSQDSGFPKKEPSFNLFDWLIQDVLPSANEKEIKTICLSFVKSMEGFYSQCRALSGNQEQLLIDLKRVFVQLYESMSNHSLKKHMLCGFLKNTSDMSDVFKAILPIAITIDAIRNDDIYYIINFLSQNHPAHSGICDKVLRFYLNLENLSEDLKYSLIESILKIQYLDMAVCVNIVKDYVDNGTASDLLFIILANTNQDPEVTYNEIIQCYASLSVPVSHELQYKLMELIAANTSLSIDRRETILKKYVQDENNLRDLLFIVQNPDIKRLKTTKMAHQSDFS